jgi:intracellular multiplication protein IcmD
MSDDTPNVGEIASTVTSESGPGVTEVITGASEAAGAAEAAASIEKFKLHKDNPTQIPLGREK